MILNVAILGAGIGREHLEAYQALPEQFCVSHMCDLDIHRAQHVVGEDSGICVLSDMEALMMDAQVDLIDVCLPPHLHASTVVRALEAGKQVICEKPIGRSLAEVLSIQNAIERTGCSVFPVFQYRYGLAMDQLAQLRKADLLGRALVASAETHWNRDSDYYSVPWRGTWQGEAGGAVLGHAIHCHDLICHVLGPVKDVSAFTDTRVNPIEVEDCAAIALRMQNGALVTSSVTLGAASDSTRLRFCFDRLTAEGGTAAYTPAQEPWTFTARGKTEQAHIDHILAAVKQKHPGFTGFFAGVHRAITTGDNIDAVSFSDGARSIEFVTAVYLSSRENRRISLPVSEGQNGFYGWQPDVTHR